MRFWYGHRRLLRDHVAMALGAFTLALAAPRDADACGACYGPANESTIVNDHKMALSLGKQQTVLWDQISYSGNPKEFAYVLPARPGTRIEPSSEAWFTALDQSTRPIIMAPPQAYGGGGYGDDSSGGGCSCFPSAADSASFASGDRASGGENGREPVQVIEQKVVGPYETVTVRSTEPDALDTWLRAHGFGIPEASGPIIADYVKNVDREARRITVDWEAGYDV